MINFNELPIVADGLNYIKQQTVGSVSVGKIVSENLDLDFNIEGRLISISGTYKESKVNLIANTDNHTETFVNYLHSLEVGNV